MSTIQKLKDEVGRLQKKLNSTKKPIAERNKFESENTKLKAEVENLTRINNEVINSRDELRRQLDAKEAGVSTGPDPEMFAGHKRSVADEVASG